jgi:hypothetical protein
MLSMMDLGRTGPTTQKRERPAPKWSPRRMLADGSVVVLEGTEDEQFVFVDGSSQDEDRS